MEYIPGDLIKSNINNDSSFLLIKEFINDFTILVIFRDPNKESYFYQYDKRFTICLYSTIFRGIYE